SERPDMKPPRPGDRPGERPDMKPPHGDHRPDIRPPHAGNHRPNDYHPGHGFTPRPTHPAPPPPPGHFGSHHHHPPHPPHHRYYSPFWGSLFFLPPPPPMYYYQEEVFIYPPTIITDGLEYYDDSVTSAPITETPEISIEDLTDPMNRFYTWDAFRYYGWMQQYQPFHESWRDACEQGIGFAAAYDTSVSRYHYYPVHSVRPGTELITDNDGLTTVFKPEKEKDSILPIVETTLAPEDVDEAWELIYAGDEYFRNTRPASAEEQYARAMISQREMPDPWVRLAVVQLSRKQYHDAFQSITTALDLSHQWPASPFTLSQMYGYQTTKKEKDLDALRQALKKDTQNAELQLVYAFMLYADSLGDVEKGKETRKEFQRAVELNPLLAPELENIISFLSSEIERVESKE
ncbi:MAG: tetratricopeptide repeat protein, partial [Planctomycetia bacterium]|nr:tetratricopeptide repeat protein [Planctomycetia bacterium]